MGFIHYYKIVHVYFCVLLQLEITQIRDNIHNFLCQK